MALVVLGGVGGYLTYLAYGAGDRVYTESRVVSEWESVGQFRYGARVVTSVGPFTEGTVLRGRSVYFEEIAPILNGSFAYAYTASDGGNVTADVSLGLSIRMVQQAETEENVTVIWQIERQLAERRRSLAPGQRVEVPFSTNVSSASRRIGSINSRLGSVPGEPEVEIVARVDLSGTRNGEQFDAVRTYRLPLTLAGSVYRVRNPGPVEESGRRTRPVRIEVPRDPGPVKSLGGPAMVTVALAALVALAAGRRTGVLEISEAERSWLAYRSNRDEFDDWIATGSVPDVTTDGVRIELDSLEGIVDVAIDSNRRVIECTDRDEFVVLCGNATYSFRPPPRPDADPVPEIGILGSDGDRDAAANDRAGDHGGTDADSADGDGDATDA